MKQRLFNSLQEAGSFAMEKTIASKNESTKFETLTATQKKIYNYLIFGLSKCSTEELQSMSKSEKSRIYHTHKEVKKVLEQYKKEVIILKSNTILKSLFPKSSLIFNLLEDTSTDEKAKVVLTFKELGITRTQIICKLHENNLLPKDFTVL